MFRKSTLSRRLEENSLNIAEPSMLHDMETVVPYNIVDDDAFPFRPYIMNPYARRDLTVEERIFNYRFSRARRIIENAFGILANRFRILILTIQSRPEVVQNTIMASSSLHNFLRTQSSRNMLPGSVDRENIDGTIIKGDRGNEGGCPDIIGITNTYSRDAKEIGTNIVNILTLMVKYCDRTAPSNMYLKDLSNSF